MRTDLVESALSMALTMRGRLPGQVIFHADRGTQGGFNWLSQHLVIWEVFDGSSAASSRSRCAGCDEVAGHSAASA
jgi:putative transposase